MLSLLAIFAAVSTFHYLSLSGVQQRRQKTSLSGKGLSQRLILQSKQEYHMTFGISEPELYVYNTMLNP